MHPQDMTTLLVVQQAVLQALIRKMVSLGGLSPEEMVALLDQAERDAAPASPTSATPSRPSPRCAKRPSTPPRARRDTREGGGAV